MWPLETLSPLLLYASRLSCGSHGGESRVDADVKSVLKVVASVVLLHEMMQREEKRNLTFLIILFWQSADQIKQINVSAVQSGISTAIKNADAPVRCLRSRARIARSFHSAPASKPEQSIAAENWNSGLVTVIPSKLWHPALKWGN